MRFERQALLGDGAFGEAGRPTGMYWDRHAQRLAVAGSFNTLQWHARDVQARRAFTYRVGVYDARAARRIATFDQARFPINDVAFHPHRPLLAVASGSYDGGYFYEGDLFIWDLETGDARSILDEDREITRCWFDDEGYDLHITLRPRDDTDGDDLLLKATLGQDAWRTARAGRVAVSALDLTPVNATEGQDGQARQDEESIQDSLEDVARHAGVHYEPRWFVWDLAWTDVGDIVAVRNKTAFEHWTAQGARLQHVADPWDGVQLALTPTGDAYVNLSTLHDVDGRWRLETRVEQIEVRTGRRSPFSPINFAALLSLSSSGALLARDTGTDRLYTGQWRRDSRSRDRVLTPEADPPWAVPATIRLEGLTVSEPLGLGGYDLFNHFLRIDGAPHLYFVHGTPSDLHEDRWICRIDPSSLRVERLFPLAWEPNREGHLQGGSALYVNDGMGSALIMSHQRSDGRGLQKGGVPIVRRRLDDGHTLWVTDFDAPVTTMAAMPERNMVVFALNDGHVGLISTDTGKLRLLEGVEINGVPSIYLALAVRGSRIAAGTIDGRIVVDDVVEA